MVGYKSEGDGGDMRVRGMSVKGMVGYMSEGVVRYE